MIVQSSSGAFGARYLEDPGVFPGGSEGEPWGSGALSLRVAGASYAVTGLSPAQERTLRALWSDFIIEGASGASPISVSAELSVFRTPAASFRTFDRWVYDLEFDYAETSVRIAGLDLMARLELAPELRGAVWIASEERETFHAAFENFFRVVVAYGALGKGGGLIHSAAVVEKETHSAWLFVGRSGAGKSTVSRLGLESGRVVLSDDLNPILPNEHRGIDVLGSPFLGEEGTRTPARRPVKGIYRLEQDSDDSLRPMAKAEALASLIACSPYVNFDPLRADSLWENFTALAGNVPAYVLTFRREGTFWPLLNR